MSDIAKFTPGPWDACERGDYADDGIVILGDERRIAVVYQDEGARLIAAAPELYATLDFLLAHLAELDRAERHRNRNNPTAVLHAQICINNVRNALAKARGEA